MKRRRDKLKNTSRSAVVAALLSLLLVALNGCALVGNPNPGVTKGLSQAEATERLMAMEGLTEGSASVISHYEGFQRRVSIQLVVKVDPGYSIARGSEFVDYLVRLAWSINNTRPNRSLYIHIKTDPQIDVPAAFRRAGWKDENGPDSFALLRVSDLKDEVGEWPGNAPTAPPDLLQKLERDPVDDEVISAPRPWPRGGADIGRVPWCAHEPESPRRNDAS
jgi:hypothetical protein